MGNWDDENSSLIHDRGRPLPPAVFKHEKALAQFELIPHRHGGGYRLIKPLFIILIVLAQALLELITWSSYYSCSLMCALSKAFNLKPCIFHLGFLSTV